MDEVVKLGLPVLAEPQAQSQLPLGDWSNAAFGNDLSMKDLLWLNDVMLAQPQDQTRLPVAGIQHTFDQPACGAIVLPEPGSQTPGIAINGEALRPPPLELPSDTQNATASGCYAQKISTRISAGTTANKAAPEVPRDKRKPSARRTVVRSGVNKRATKFVCEECTKTEGRLVSFNCEKDRQRHKRTTRAHNAPPVAFCSCGTSVTRRDAMKSHRAYCRGTTVEPEAAQAAGN
jgi:hypothetical protein